MREPTLKSTTTTARYKTGVDPPAYDIVALMSLHNVYAFKAIFNRSAS